MRTKLYQELAARTDAPMPKSYDSLGSIHMLMGIVTEAGELTDPFKKHLAYGKEIDMVNVKEEVGDLMWYIANFCNINGFDLEEIMATNIAKLQTRYPDKFKPGDAINRDITRERNLLEHRHFNPNG